MSRYTFMLATQGHDAQLRARMAADHMEGAIAVSFRREPSYFAGCAVQGDHTQVVTCIDSRNSHMAGLGSRSTAMALVNGAQQRIGYLSDLRVAPEYRRGTLLARGYRYFRELHQADPVPFYTTMIYDGNTPALANLQGARGGLPLYRDWGKFLTPALRLNFGVASAPAAGVTIERGTPEKLPHIVSFLNRNLAARQFAPVYRESDFPNGRFKGLQPKDFFLAIRDGRIAGTMAAWDQAAYRQTHVERYGSLLTIARPFYNAAACVSPVKRLPDPGARIPYVYLACLATVNDDVSVFRHLLHAVHDAIRGGPWHYAIAGLHERDPRARALLALRHIPAAGRLFVVHYADEAPMLDTVSTRVPYLEAGCL